jgi:RHS repeat-associated protein
MKDLHGDVVGMAEAGEQSFSKLYSPYGEPEEPRAVAGTDTRLGFQGDYTDKATGLVDMGARLYDPTLARFISRDTEFGDLKDPTSLNQFAYANGNPISSIDPSGMAAIQLWQNYWAELAAYEAAWAAYRSDLAAYNEAYANYRADLKDYYAALEAYRERFQAWLSRAVENGKDLRGSTGVRRSAPTFTMEKPTFTMAKPTPPTIARPKPPSESPNAVESLVRVYERRTQDASLSAAQRRAAESVAHELLDSRGDTAGGPLVLLVRGSHCGSDLCASGSEMFPGSGSKPECHDPMSCFLRKQWEVAETISAYHPDDEVFQAYVPRYVRWIMVGTPTTSASGKPLPASTPSQEFLELSERDQHIIETLHYTEVASEIVPGAIAY